jgi:hypothetical protein
MIEFGGEAQIDGPYGRQPVLVKVASVLWFAAFLVMGISVPVSVAVAVLGGAGTPADSRAKMFGALLFLAAMLAIGAWVTAMYIGWLSGGRVGAAGRCVVLLAAAVLSAAVATVAVLLHVWPAVCAFEFALVPVAPLAGWVLVKISRVINGPPSPETLRRWRTPWLVPKRRAGRRLTSAPPPPSSSPEEGRRSRRTPGT